MDELSRNNQMEDGGAQFGMRNLLILCLRRWRWYVVTVVVALAIAAFYVKTTPPMYKRDASIMVLDGRQESSALGKMLADFTDMGFSFSDKANVNNVIAAIQSPDVMREVVATLGIDVSYTSPGTFYDATLYGKTLPVTVKFRDIDEDETASMTLKLLGDGNVEMAGFAKNGKAVDSEPLQCRVGQTVHTPLGILTIAPTDYYAKAGGKGKRIDVRKSDLNSATGRFLGGLSVAIGDKKSTILNLSYTDLSTKRAEDILSAVVDTYNEVWVKNRSRVSNSTSRFIDERLAIIERELGNVDTDIANYKSKNLVPDVEMAYTLSMERADKNSATLLDLNTRLSVARYIRDYIADKANTNQLIPVDLGLENDKIDEQIKNYNAIQLERNQMIANSGRQNPLVHDMDKQLAQIRRAIIYSMDNMMMSLSTRISHLQNDEQKTNTNISANPTQAKFLLSVERQQKVKEALYLFLLQKREENELARAFNADNTQVIKSPTGSNAPISPKGSVIMLIGLVAGLALPTAVIYLLEVSNTTIRGRRDVEGSVTAPMLGELPRIGGGSRNVSQLKASFGIRQAVGGECRIVVEAGSRNSANEAFRIMRTNFEFMAASETAGSVTMFTSAASGTGKTFATANLAAVLALGGKSVLAIDGDMRKGSLSGFVGNPNKGLAGYLAGTYADAAELVCPYAKCPGLDIMPVGTLPDNPTELLSSGRLEPFVDEMRRRYDYVLIDCPPVNVVADTAIIARNVDNTVFVLRAGMTDRSVLPDVEKLYLSARLRNMTLVINDVACTEEAFGTDTGYVYAGRHL
ncbi:GumC family protein [Marseilla massiliensis]|uniref:GumC family protein n=1 Tax=Marseilla massiliensis TaxID=1841864 RepID=UPI0030C8CAD8